MSAPRGELVLSENARFRCRVRVAGEAVATEAMNTASACLARWLLYPRIKCVFHAHTRVGTRVSLEYITG